MTHILRFRSSPTVLVTGAQGFVGSYLCRQLIKNDYKVRAVVRRSNGMLPVSPALEVLEVGDLTHFTGWSRLLRDADYVVHLVARTHITDEFGATALAEYRRVNVDLTRRLAKACVRHGVGQLIYMSSIKAVGNGGDVAYSEATECRPEDSYGITKLEAEEQLAETLQGSDCRLTILRPPLIYGPGVGGNFLRLLQLVQKGVPLPSVANSRSMLHVENLVDAATRCLETAASYGQVFHVADPQPVSTADLVRSMATGLGRTPILLPLPKLFLTGVGQLAGRTEEVRRLVGSLVVTTEKIERELGWVQRFDTREGVFETSSVYRKAPWRTEPKTRSEVAAKAA